MEKGGKGRGEGEGAISNNLGGCRCSSLKDDRAYELGTSKSLGVMAVRKHTSPSIWKYKGVFPFSMYSSQKTVNGPWQTMCFSLLAAHGHNPLLESLPITMEGIRRTMYCFVSGGRGFLPGTSDPRQPKLGFVLGDDS